MTRYWSETGAQGALLQTHQATALQAEREYCECIPEAQETLAERRLASAVPQVASAVVSNQKAPET